MFQITIFQVTTRAVRIRSIANLVDSIGQHLDFFIVTSSGDLKSEPTANLPLDRWVSSNNANIYYARRLTFGVLRRTISQSKPDLVYLNSFFARSAIRLLLMRKAHLLPAIPALMAPRGQFALGAMNLKSLRKRLFVSLAFKLGLYDNLVWQATSKAETDDIRRVVAADCEIYLVPNLPAKPTFVRTHPPKVAGEVRFVFLSRISRMKNLDYLLKILQDIRGRHVCLDIFGPIGERKHWNQCRPLIDALRGKVDVHCRGEARNESVAEILADYHFFVLPTAGENFGHAIFEALGVGLPVIISDRTPWQALEMNDAGWCVPLEFPEQWCSTLQRCVDMEGEDYNRLANGAHRFAAAWIGSSQTEVQTVGMFRQIVEKGRATPSAR